MANIAAFLTAIKNAVYGEEVRDAIHDSIEAMNDQVEDVKNVRTEFAEDLATCNEKAAIATAAVSAVQIASDPVHSIIGISGCEYTFLSSRKLLYNNGGNNPSSASNAKLRYYIPLYNAYGIGDYSGEDAEYIRTHKDSWYCCQALYGEITSQGQQYEAPFDQIVVENCVNLTEDPTATLFDDTYTLPAVKDVMTRRYLFMPASAAAEYCTLYVCDAFSSDASHILAELRINKDTRITCGTAWRGISVADKNKQLALTPMISIQNAIIDLQQS